LDMAAPSTISGTHPVWATPAELSDDACTCPPKYVKRLRVPGGVAVRSTLSASHTVELPKSLSPVTTADPPTSDFSRKWPGVIGNTHCEPEAYWNGLGGGVG